MFICGFVANSYVGVASNIGSVCDDDTAVYVTLNSDSAKKNVKLYYMLYNYSKYTNDEGLTSVFTKTLTTNKAGNAEIEITNNTDYKNPILLAWINSSQYPDVCVYTYGNKIALSAGINADVTIKYSFVDASEVTAVQAVSEVSE